MIIVQSLSSENIDGEQRQVWDEPHTKINKIDFMVLVQEN